MLKVFVNFVNIWFPKSRVSSFIGLDFFAQKSRSHLGLATLMSRLGLGDFGRDSSSVNQLTASSNKILIHIIIIFNS